MPRKKKEPFTFQSNFEKVSAKIQEKPFKVMNIIGQNLVREVKATTMKEQFHVRRGLLTKTLGYWARKKEKDLQIGFKMSIPGVVGKMITGEEEDPLKLVVVKNTQIIQDAIATALDEIRKE